jgi:hypothetical protein
MAGKLSMDAFLSKLLASQIYIPSATEVQADGRGLNPIVYDRNGVRMAAIFTHLDRIEPSHTQLASFCLQVDAAWLIRNMQPDMGVVLFAGPGRGCEFPPETLHDLRLRLPRERDA